VLCGLCHPIGVKKRSGGAGRLYFLSQSSIDVGSIFDQAVTFRVVRGSFISTSYH
jgi:hypothetical protein